MPILRLVAAPSPEEERDETAQLDKGVAERDLDDSIDAAEAGRQFRANELETKRKMFGEGRRGRKGACESLCAFPTKWIRRGI